MNIVRNAESHGARGHLVESAADIESTLERALDQAGVDVIDVLVHD